MFMMDEVVGHMVERVAIPAAFGNQGGPRKWTHKPKGEYRAFATTADDPVPEMTKAGEGYRIHVTGLTHDERGYPAMNAVTQDKLVRRLLGKIRDNADKIMDVREDGVEGADVVVVSYGITSRIAMSAVEEARQRGAKVGHLRLVVAWPFPAKRIRELGQDGQDLHHARIEHGADGAGNRARSGRSGPRGQPAPRRRLGARARDDSGRDPGGGR